MIEGGGVSLDPARNRLEEVFSDALEQAPEYRASFLDRACEGDEALRAEVEALLAADNSDAGFMTVPAYESEWVGLAGVGRAPFEATPGMRIGAYTIVRLIATGGMGSVYEAVQDHPHRTVALKIMRGGVSTPEDIRRFQFEADVLGRLQHPGIARIYEAGMHQEGQRSLPYFAMEYLPDARTIVDYVEAGRLPLREKLELFCTVCDAVQYGHQKGVVHRDLKPGNILVGTEALRREGTKDATTEEALRASETSCVRAFVKVIDFGVAVATESDLQSTRHTDVREVVGTLQYMSPEQVRGDSGEVDTRSDVYSLGVILYELLAGVRPFDLSRMNLIDAIRTIEAANARPMGEVDSTLRGDLSTIVATAMAAEKQNRYQSAADLSGDVRRYLRNEPISARPFSRIYYIRKFASRNRALVIGIFAAVMGLMIGTSVAVWKAVEATRQRNLAVAEAQRAEQINIFLRSILNAADPRSSMANVSIREAVERAVANFDRTQVSDPRTYAQIENMIGGIYARMGRTEDAARHLSLAVEAYRQACGGADDHSLANAISDLAWVTPIEGGMHDKNSLQLFSEALAIKRRLLGDRHASVANLMVCVATCQRDMGQFEVAVETFEQALDILRVERGEESVDYAFAVTMLANCRSRQNRLEEAEELFRGAIAVQKRLLGEDHVQVAISLDGYSRVLARLGRTSEAEAVQSQADAIRARRIGPMQRDD